MSSNFPPFVPTVALFSLLALSGRAAAQGVPIGFEEQFALSPDRAKALEQLIPGTEDYYYYHCLNLQNEGALDQVAPLLEIWIKRHGRGARVEEIENRQALLGFERNPGATYDFLRGRLGLRFDHQRQVVGEKPDLPTRLDPELISKAALSRRALKQHPGSLDGFQDSALPELVTGPLDDALLMSLLQRLSRPDLPNLPALIVRNLRDEHSQGFGSLSIHRMLLLEQLEECARLEPSLLRQDDFIQAMLLRLSPGADIDWSRDAAECEAYLLRLQQFTERLGPAHNSLKAHVLYHRFVHDLTQGRPDKERLLAYLRLPRQASYVNPDFLKSRPRSEALVDFGQAYATTLGPIGNDESLVRAYLSHFFAREDSYEPYTELLREEYLKRLFAETRILAGSEEMERWYSMLDDPAYYEQLKERVEIDFPPGQRTEYGVDEKVELSVDLKSVDTLLVKLFRINTLNFHVEQQREIDASINLDGLVANQEHTYTYQENPLHRVRRSFTFDDLPGPGVYVIDFIGNGLSSRAVIRKGRLQVLERQGAAGHVLRVLDSSGRHLKDAAVMLGGHEYTADGQGEIRVPYSTKPEARPLVLRHGAFSTLETLQHAGENYHLETGVFVEREALLPGRTARILVRPSLTLNGFPVSLELLEDAVLQITSTDWHGVASASEVRSLELSRAQELTHEIQVPERLFQLSVRLTGRVASLSRAETIDVASEPRLFQVNSIEKTNATACSLLGRSDAGYTLDLLGKNGEPRPDLALTLTLGHRDFSDPIQVTLKSDARGRIHLGALDGIESLLCQGQGLELRWWLATFARTYPRQIRGRAGEVLRVPYLGRATRLSRGVASLLELRGGVFAHDRFDHLFLKNGYLELRDLPPGDYSLALPEVGRQMRVQVTAGPEQAGWGLGQSRLLELGGSGPLQIVALGIEGEALAVRLAAAGPSTRVHLFSTRYLPSFDVFESMRLDTLPGLGARPAAYAMSDYHSGLEIGDEYRYILERRYAKKFPGNMLRRPGLLLNPWALAETDTSIGAGGGPGGRHAGRGARKGGAEGPASPGPGGAGNATGDVPNLQFLAHPGAALLNLRPDVDGVVRVPLSELGDGQLLHAVALDGESTVYRSLARAERSLERTDRRLPMALDPTQHFAERRRIDLVEGGASTSIEDLATSELESYDSLASVHQLFLTLSQNQDLARFAFLLRWPQLGPEEQRELYSRHACHELHFFLHEKDPGFFSAVIRPYLANKAHKTFLDHWLLEDDLSAYFDPWAFSRLNVVERILLSRRLPEQAESVARHLNELVELEVPDPVALAHLFKSALSARALERDQGAVGFLTGMGPKKNKVYKGPGDSVRPGPGGPVTPGGGPGAPATGRTAVTGGVVREALKEKELQLEDAAAETQSSRAALKGLALSQDLEARAETRKLYRAPEATRRFVEHNYWHLPIEQQNGDLIEANAFWSDYAKARGDRPFLSNHFPEAAGNFAEMMLALAVLDLPFVPGKHEIERLERGLFIRAAGPLLLLRQEIRPADPASRPSPILLNQNFFRLDDRFVHDGNRRLDKFETDEFLTGVAYGCQVVLTNPGSTPEELELLLQIPEGAIPLQASRETRGLPVQIEPFGTARFEFSFYFPEVGRFPHYPAHASRDGEQVASAAPMTLNAVAEPSRVDATSWEHISQTGGPEQVIEYLEGINLLRPDLSRIAWRLRERPCFDAFISLLRRRHVYDHTLWSYSLYHLDASTSREYLSHASGLLGNCGAWLDSPLVEIDPIERRAYQHVEYRPLFNGRAHPFGKQREILNADLARQYLQLLRILAYRPRLDDSDWMSVTYYLLLQDRVEEALASFARVDAARLPTALQYDYLRAYMDFFSNDHAVARGIAENYRQYPVERWRLMFLDVLNQLDEAEGRGTRAGDPEDRTQSQTELAATEPSLDLKVESRSVTLGYQNLESCQVDYYVMDIEFLFSTSAFVQQGSGSFSFIQPNRSDRLALPADRRELVFDLPEEFQNSNVLVEVRGQGLARRQAYYANSLAVQLLENYGQLKVAHRVTDQPLPKVYVKVYARTGDGQVRFHKDGYTDLRGRFDYASLSGAGAEDVERFAILILSDTDGAVIREVTPPVE